MDKNELTNNIKISSKNQNNVIMKLSILEIFFREKNIIKSEEKIRGIISNLEDQNTKIIELKTEIFNNIINIKDDFSSISKKNINYYIDIRNDIHKTLMDLSRYLTEISYYNNIYYDFLSRKQFDKNIPISFEDFYKKIYDYLMIDKMTINQKIAEVIWVIPMKITKQKYYSILSNSLKKSFKNLNKEKCGILFKRYKSIFNGTLEWEYVNAFDKYFRITQNYKEVDYKNISQEELDKNFIDSKNIIREIEDLLEFLRELGLIINKFIIVHMIIDEMDKEDKKKVEIFLQDLTKYDYKMLLNKSNEIESDLMKVTKVYQEDTQNIINNNIGIDKNLEDIYSKTEKILSYLNDYYIESEELLIKNDESIEQNYLDKLISNFIEFIERNIKNMDNTNRKIRMKKILTLLEIPFNTPDDFFDYLKSSIEFNNDRKEIQYIMNEVYNILNHKKSSH